MIFVTVGTHEQSFDRLVKYIDGLKRQNIIQEDIVIQTGFSTYKPKYCTWSKFFSFSEMEKNVANARIVITHGGPASFIMPLQIGKIPIVVPRQKNFNEHINNHQVMFCKAVAKRMGTIIIVENIEKLKENIINYENIIATMPIGLRSNNKKFNEKFEKIVNEIFENNKVK